MLNFALVQRLLPLCRALWWLCSLLPLRLHYFFADVLIFPLVFHVLKYRRALVQRQLAEAFPTRSAEERAQIERDFYHWFADYVVETLKLMSISRKELYRRMDFVNLHEVLRELRNGEHQFVFLYLGHFGNWEWVSSLPLWSDGGIHFGQIYHPLHSPLMDELFLHVRGRMGATNRDERDASHDFVVEEKRREGDDWFYFGPISEVGGDAPLVRFSAPRDFLLHGCGKDWKKSGRTLLLSGHHSSPPRRISR